MQVLEFLYANLPRPVAFTLAGLYIVVGRFWRRPIRWTLNLLVNLSVFGLAVHAAMGWYLDVPTRNGNLWWQTFFVWTLVVAIIDHVFSDPVFDDHRGALRLPSGL